MGLNDHLCCLSNFQRLSHLLMLKLSKEDKIGTNVCLKMWNLSSLHELFHLAWYPLDLSMLLQVAWFHFLLMTEWYPSVYTYCMFFISVGGHLGCFHILAILNNAVMNTGRHTSFWIWFFVFFRSLPWCATAGSYGSSIFNFLRTLQAAFFSGCTSLHSQQVWGFLCLHHLSNFCYLLSFWLSFWQVWGDTSLWFWFAFSWELLSRVVTLTERCEEYSLKTLLVMMK